MIDKEDTFTSMPTVNIHDMETRIIQLESVLRFLLCVDFDYFSEHDEALLDSVLADAKKLLGKE